MILNRLVKSLGASLLLLALLVNTVAAGHPEDDQGHNGIFGKVTEVDGDTLHVSTKNGDVLIQVTVDTLFRSRLEGQEAPEGAYPGDRIAAGRDFPGRPAGGAGDHGHPKEGHRSPPHGRGDI